jgi:hypothetical protein
MHRRTFTAAALAALAAPAFAQTQGQQAALRPVIEAENELERRFLAAMEDEAARPAFRRALLVSEVALAISSRTPDAPPRQIELRPGYRACLIFTSSARATAVMGANAPRVMMTGREALQRVRGANVIINVNLAPMLTLEPEDVDALLAMPDQTLRSEAPQPQSEPESVGPAQ